MHTFTTIILPCIAAAALASCAVAIALRFRAAKLKADLSFMRHTIEVNINILKGELIELTGLTAAADAPLSRKVVAANVLLGESATVVSQCATRITSNSGAELAALLTEVFNAMNKSSRARHLLGACKPFVGE